MSILLDQLPSRFPSRNSHEVSIKYIDSCASNTEYEAAGATQPVSHKTVQTLKLYLKFRSGTPRRYDEIRRTKVLSEVVLCICHFRVKNAGQNIKLHLYSPYNVCYLYVYYCTSVQSHGLSQRDCVKNVLFVSETLAFGNRPPHGLR